MNIRIPVFAGICLGIAVASPLTMAADQDRDRTQLQSQDRIYGYQLMTPKERSQYRESMRAATTAQERQRIRNEHHKLMQERARERGISLPDTPPARGTGGGMGNGMGGGGGRGR